MSETVAYDASTGQLAGSGLVEPPRAIRLPDPLRDNLRAMTRSQMLDLRAEPERHGRVRDAKASLVRALTDQAVKTTIDRHLREHGAVEFVQDSPNRRRYAVQADSFRAGAFEVSGREPIQVRQFEGMTTLLRILAEGVLLGRRGELGSGEPLFELELLNAEVTDLRAGGLVNRRARLADQRLKLSGLELDTFDVSLDELLAKADASPGVGGAVERIEERLESLDREITSRILSRHSQAATGIMLLVLGATLAMWLRRALPLVIYTWAFLPSILNLIMISGGDKMMRDGNILGGLTVMWGGNAAILLIFLFAYWRLSKN